MNGRCVRGIGVATTSAFLLLALPACMSSSTPADAPVVEEPVKARVERSAFGTLPDGRTVEAFTLTNANGISLTAITYGGIVTSIRTPDRDGEFADIVLGYDNLDGYLQSSPYFGAIVGRYGNRIAKGRFTVDGKAYSLATNNGPNALHGGLAGFDKVLWRAEPWDSATKSGVVFSYTSKDGEEGYPGTLDVRVTYALTDDDEFAIEYVATTDKATPVNLTQHTYFNLAGAGSGTVLNQRVMINADTFTPVDSTLIPTGELQSVTGTPFDFRRVTAIGERIDARNPQLAIAGGYDHNFVISRSGDGLVHAAHAVDPVGGRSLDVTTTEPGVQFYSGNFLDGTLTGKGGRKYEHRSGFCLETQHFPDSPNQSSFPSTILRPGTEYRSQTVYSFGVEKLTQ